MVAIEIHHVQAPATVVGDVAEGRARRGVGVETSPAGVNTMSRSAPSSFRRIETRSPAVGAALNEAVMFGGDVPS